MKQALLAAATATGFFALALVVLAGGQALGALDSDSVIGLSGKAVMIAESRIKVEELLVFYPALPLYLAVLCAYVSPDGVLPAVLATAFVAAAFASILFQGFLYRGFAWGSALAATLLVTGNPLALHALMSGPGAMLILVTLFIFAKGVFGLSTKGAAPDMMLTGLALMFFPFMHPYGLILSAASIPGLSLVAPPSFMARTPASLFLILLFPLGFAVLAYAYVRWVFGAEAFGFLDSVGSPVIDATMGNSNIWTSAIRALLGTVLAAPLITAFLVWTRRRAHLALPAVALTSLVAGAALLQLAFGAYADNTIAFAAALPVAAACAIYSPRSRLHELYICVLLFAGMAGAGVVLTASASPKSPASNAARESTSQAELLRLSEILRKKEGVLVDTRSHPDFVAARGTAKGLVLPGEAEFEIQLQSHRLTSPFVVVTRAEASETQDRVAVTFPLFYDNGAPGYDRVYDQGGWRAYARLTTERGG